MAGQLLALGFIPSFADGFLAFLAVFCLSASALILNDLFDLEVDRVNAPQRPLPSGLVSPTEVKMLAALTATAGLIISFRFGLSTLILATFLWVIGFLYNWRFKKTGLPGNLMVALSVGATFVYGAMTIHEPWSPVVWVFSLIAFLFDLGEEIAGDAMDMAGDRKIGSKSIALQKGWLYALRVSVLLWGLVVPLGLIPILYGWLKVNYLPVLLLIDGLLVYFSIKLLFSRDPDEGHRAMRGAYISISLCMLVFVCLRIYMA